jgi:hypothetical protein
MEVLCLSFLIQGIVRLSFVCNKCMVHLFCASGSTVINPQNPVIAHNYGPR